MGDLSGPFAQAYRDAEARKAQAEAEAERAAAQAEAEAVAHRVYDPRPYAEAEPDPVMYAGTGIGALYGLPGSERFLPELGGWRIGRES